jgi:hypothetical protein
MDYINELLDAIRRKVQANHQESHNSVKHFLIYWREENVVAHDESKYPLDVVASNQLGRVKSGNTVLAGHNQF